MAMPKAYEGNEPYIFISYAHKDSDKVIPMIQALQDRGFRVWFDAGIEAGSEWPAYIAMHLSNCGCFIPFLTPNYMASDNCRQEIYFALRKKRTLLPVYLEEAELDIGLEMQLSPIQALMLQKSMGTDALLQEMCKSAKLTPCMGKASAPTAKPTPKPAPQPAPKPSTPAELYQQGKKLYDKSRYTEAFPLLQKAAEQGYADAQYQLGWCYFCGNGVTQNMKTATEWYRKAADLGHAKAQCELAYCYFKGHGVSSSDAEAFKWYQKAAELGFAKAQYELARCYKFGYGVTQDPKQALYWMQKAAQQKYPNAESLVKSWSEQYNPQTADAKPVPTVTPSPAAEVTCVVCGNKYSSAEDMCPICTVPTSKNLSTATSKNAISRNMTAEEVIAKAAPEVKQKTPEEMAAQGLNHYRSGNYGEAVVLFQKAKEAGNVDGTFYLACCYAEGKGVPQDFIHAMELYWNLPSNTKTYMYENPDRKVLFAKEAIVQWYIDTLQRTKKYTKNQMHAFLQKYAEKGNDLTTSLLADKFQAKHLYTAAFILFRALADHDRPSAFSVAMYYHFGLGVVQNSQEAIKWYLKHKDFNSCAMLAVMYEEGHGVKKSWFEAQKWWNEYKKLAGKSADIQTSRDAGRKWAQRKEWIL